MAALLEKAKEAMDEKKDEESATDDESEEEGIGGQKKEKTEEEKKKEEENTKNRKKDAEKIAAGGDFQVQVHIIEGRELAGKDSGGTSDPVVTITIFDKKKST